MKQEHIYFILALEQINFEQIKKKNVWNFGTLQTSPSLGASICCGHTGSTNISSSYAPNFEEVAGAYWFWVVHAPVLQKLCMLGF